MNRFWRGLDLIIGAIFIYAGTLKAMQPLRFANDIENYHVVPWALGVRFAFYLPWLEIFCGIALVSRRLYGGALAILIALTCVFVGATISAKVRGIDITCGCFGRASDNLSFTSHLALNLAIFAALILLAWRTNLKRDTPT
jgi:putative oxidoreductase